MTQKRNQNSEKSNNSIDLLSEWKFKLELIGRSRYSPLSLGREVYIHKKSPILQ